MSRFKFHARVLVAETPAEIAREIERTESDPEGVGIMTRKGRIYPVRLDNVPLKAAPLLKQEMLSVGGDAAHSRGVADLTVERSPVVLLATLGQYRRVIPKLKRQPFQLSAISEAIEASLDHFTSHRTRVVPGVHRSLTLGERTLVMGVVNVTPDSFSDGGRFVEPAAAIAHALALQAEGADLLDIGAESTRPGARSVDPEEEWARIAPVLDGLAGRAKVPISVDTRHSSVAERALRAGADLVNDVSGLSDPSMREVVARARAAVVIMHMRGTPETMQSDTDYADLRGDVFSYLQEASDAAVEVGVRADRILVDPGLGFGKTAEQNWELLGHLGELRSLGFPILVGASRKSFLGRAAGAAGVEAREAAGVAASTIAALRGASVVRTHDVAATRQAMAVVEALRSVAPRTAPVDPVDDE